MSQIEDSSYLDLDSLKEDSIVYTPPKPKRQALPYQKKINHWSLVPGAGQWINKKYHKVPIFLGAMSYMVYKQREAHSLYKNLNQNLENLFDDNPLTINNSGIDSVFIPEHLKAYNMERSLYFFGSMLIYGLNIADARLDAQIKLFPEKNYRPQRAAMYSAMVPGLGQIYNKKYWKLPLLYGGAAGLGYYYYINNESFEIFNTAYIQKKNNISEENWTNPEYFEVSQSQLERLSEKYRKQREQSMLYIILLYAGNVIDATVDAHLSDFNINESIDISFVPMQTQNNLTFGLNVQFSLD